MKRKLKMVGLSAILISVVSLVVHSAASGGIGFGIAVILCFFLAVFSLVGLFIVSLKIYSLLKSFPDRFQTVFPSNPKKKRSKPIQIVHSVPKEEEEKEDD